MIEKLVDEGFEIYCDFCEETETIFETDWLEMMRDLKAMDWKVRKDSDGDWQHICPDCRESCDFRPASK